MAEDTEFETGGSREYGRVLLVACCLLAVVVAGTLVPALTAGGGVSGSPIESALPDEEVAGGGADIPGSGGSGSLPGGSGGGTLGALNPGEYTGVGGAIDENAFRSQNAQTHFTVRSAEPAYWRTGAYGEYTGAGWQRTETTRPYDGPLALGGANGTQVAYEVTLNRSATSLPTVWQPRSVAGLGVEAVVTDRRALRPVERLPSGTTYTGVSSAPPRDPDLLRSTGQDYPEAIESRYATLSDDVPGRVGLFTDDLTANTSTPYGTAQRVESWLEENKEYSLNVSRQGENIADSFIFEMDRGYCEYYATAMVVMLRSQGVPARYAVGYSTGQQVAENTYQVRNLNAHAWVEVYFEDVGWVKFDPTPGGARLDSEQSAVEEQRPGTDYDPREQGSPGETFSPGEDTVEPDPLEPEGPTRRTDSGVRVALDRQPVPGATVEVTLTENTSAVAGARVLFNGEAVGVTDENGSLIATVPYAERLEVEVEKPDRDVVFVDQPVNATADNGTDRNVTAYNGAGSGTTAALGAGPPTDGRPLFTVGPGLNAVSYPVDTNATVTVAGQPRAGGTVTVVASLGRFPVRDARVLVDGEAVARTDADGRARVRLPERTGNVTVAVERDPVRGEATVEVPELSVDVEPTAPLALPLTGAEVTVELGGQPRAGIPVSVGGQRVATTDINGTATVTLPLSGSATVTVTDGGLTATGSVDGLLVNLLLVLAGLAAAVGTLAVVVGRLGYGPRELLGLCARLPVLAVRYAELALVVLATRGDDLLRAGLAQLKAAAVALADLLRGRATLGELRARLRTWYDRRRGRTAPPGVAPADAGDPRTTVRAAWRRLVERASVGRPETKTPGELAAHAVERDGLPAAAVDTLRDAFRAVEYGARPADRRLEQVRSALAAIERADAGEDGEPEGNEPGGTDTSGGD